MAGDEAVHSFVPSAQPPQDPKIKIEGQLAERLRTAEHALVRLDLASEMIPSIDWFIYAFVRKEAVISSQIEGTQVTLIDLLNFEAEHEVEPDADVEEICNHLDALSYARQELAKSDVLSISMRLLNGAHQRLMHGARGATKQPGEVRRSQNWIGGSRPGNAIYVPPPVQALPSLLGDFEKYLHTTDNLPLLVRVGLAHVRFESIHPYLDGNGRLGRLLIALLLEHWGMLKAPLLYLSLFFKRHRAEYFRRLTAVRTDGDWEGWTDFFLDAVATIADEAVASARELFAVVTSDRARVLAQDTTSASAVRPFELLPNHPIITVATAMTHIATSKPTATRAVETLIAAGILVETTGKKRDRSFAYQTYVDRLRIGTELEHR
ncbi:Fic/DOC family N-terminal domain-containing protein [Stenotrophomonas sp. SORGH_AS_0321]|uniref:Fic family protein n=1 Tax=Stenotrophomonas sp. SORGH_AS_0321 TaxID=3041787 RepID=UPI00285E1C99|nr:Fic/DOC family N-terminal domain-containing protein [Stenotrophomonas sp. SORGH_AS_0321]MDR6095553.1 Fic family protein [Stenotrophomonas sp. SORGH_AS_0321]